MPWSYWNFTKRFGPSSWDHHQWTRRTETFGEIPIRPRHNSPDILNIVNIDNGRVSLKNSLILIGVFLLLKIDNPRL